MKKNVLILSIILAAVVSVCLFFRRNEGTSEIPHTAVECIGIDRAGVQARAAGIDESIPSYISSMKDIFGQSAEGGQQADYLADGVSKLVTQMFYGETGKSEIRFYFENDNIFYITKLNSVYELPLSEDPEGQVKRTDHDEYYLGSNQNLCLWYSNGEIKESGKSAQELVASFLSHL